jgi:hypothetical protein
MAHLALGARLGLARRAGGGCAGGGCAGGRGGAELQALAKPVASEGGEAQSERWQ